jgi:type I restriction enzyme S subunit
MTGWGEATLGEICQIKPPKKEAKQKLSGKDLVSFVPMKNLGICSKDIDLCEDKPLSEVAGSYTYFAEDDVLLAKITPCFENGKLGIAKGLTNGIGFGSSEFIVFRSKGSIDPEYLFYFLSQGGFRASGARVMTGAVGHKRVPKEFIEDHPIPLPSLPEQKRIVAILDEAFAGIDAAVANTEKNLANARELFDGYLEAVFTQKGEGWVEKKLSEVCEGKITDGTHQTPKYFDEGYIFLSSRNVTSGEIDWGKIKYIDELQHVAMQKRLSPRQNDILLAKNGTTGVAAIVDRDVVFDIYVSLALLRPSENILPRYLWHFINSPVAKKQFNKRLKGTGVPNLHLNEIREVVIPLPPALVEQGRLVDMLDGFLREARRLETIYQCKLDKLSELKQSILQKAFAGELTALSDKTLKEAVA